MKKLLTGLAVASALFVSTASYADPHKGGDWLIRGGVSGLFASTSSNSVDIKDVNENFGFSTKEAIALNFNVAYFFDRNWAFEFSTASPFTHEITIHDGSKSYDAGETSHIPLIFSGLYYLDRDWDFKPYVGAGVHYTFFFGSDFSKNATDDGFKDLSFDNSYGFALQAGADYQFSRHWSGNLAVRYMGLSSDNSFGYKTSTKGSGSLRFDPWVLSLNVGYQF